MMQPNCRSPRLTAWRLSLLVLVAHLVAMAGCATSSPNYQNQQAFSDAESAVKALATAARKGDTAALEAIFGTSGREVLSSGDPVLDKQQRAVFSVAIAEAWELQHIDSSTRELIVGNEKWPFPIPLVKDKHGWWFDTIAGSEEVIARRIGRNELAAIGICHTYVVAQGEYAGESHDNKPMGIYAQKFRSDDGKHDGLYWPATAPGEKLSPLGGFAAKASAEGYSTARKQEPTPFYGYFYRILTRQGASAPGGAKNYIVNGDMTAGFALIAYPAQYGNSGIMTFLVGSDGVVHERDLGDATPEVARKINEFNPDSAWQASQ